ncbi:unnamed protein product [Scytosiphon promiscuus]
MSSPPIVQLSQVLYHDPPVPAPICATSRHPALNGIHDCCATPAVSVSRGTAEMARRAARAVRLLLPRTFAVADRAYHQSKAIEKVDTAGERRGWAASCGCCRGDSATAGQQQPEGAREEHEGRSTGSSSGTSTASTRHSETGASSERPTCSIRSAKREAEEGGGVIVVESVLGLSAVRALLDRSYAAARGGGDCSGDTSVDSTHGVSEAAGRLAGWLRIVAMSTALRRQGWPGNRSSSSSSSIIEKAAGGKRFAPMLDPALDRDEFLSAVAAVARADQRARDTLYEVTGRCEAGGEWIGFDLEPIAAGTQEQSSKFGGIEDYAAIEVLEVRLICHPLVTMVPDIRWCLRLIGQAKAFAALLNANAKLSTLGGGYFLTRQVGQAIHLALAQSEVATALGDLQLAGKCRINVAYNYIWLGQYGKAERIVDAQVAASRAIHDEELENVALIAGRFLRRSRKANRRLLRSQLDAAGGGERGGSEGTQGGDGHEWVRQKIDVKTDEWHRVRALPMYCSSGRATPVGWSGEASRGREGLI